MCIVRAMPFDPSQKSVADSLEVKVAGYTVDALGRKWDPSKHPRDSRGRFIETGGIARVGLGGLGRVVRSMLGGKVEVEMSDGSHRVVQHQQLTMVRRPDGSKPTRSVSKVLQEDDKREKDPKRGDGKLTADRDGDGLPDVPDVDPADEDDDNPDDDDHEVPDAYSPSREDAQEGDLVAIMSADKKGEPKYIIARVESVKDGKPETIRVAGEKGRVHKRDAIKANSENDTIIPREDLKDPAALFADSADGERFAVMDAEEATDLVEGHATETRARSTRHEDLQPEDLRNMLDREGTVQAHGQKVGTIKKQADGTFVATSNDGVAQKPSKSYDGAAKRLTAHINKNGYGQKPQLPEQPAEQVPAEKKPRVRKPKVFAGPTGEPSTNKTTSRVQTDMGPGYRSESGNLLAVKWDGAWEVWQATDDPNGREVDGHRYRQTGQNPGNVSRFRDEWIGNPERDRKHSGQAASQETPAEAPPAEPEVPAIDSRAVTTSYVEPGGLFVSGGKIHRVKDKRDNGNGSHTLVAEDGSTHEVYNTVPVPTEAAVREHGISERGDAPEAPTDPRQEATAAWNQLNDAREGILTDPNLALDTRQMLMPRVNRLMGAMRDRDDAKAHAQISDAREVLRQGDVPAEHRAKYDAALDRMERALNANPLNPKAAPAKQNVTEQVPASDPRLAPEGASVVQTPDAPDSPEAADALVRDKDDAGLAKLAQMKSPRFATLRDAAVREQERRDAEAVAAAEQAAPKAPEQAAPQEVPADAPPVDWSDASPEDVTRAAAEGDKAAEKERQRRVRLAMRSSPQNPNRDRDQETPAAERRKDTPDTTYPESTSPEGAAPDEQRSDVRGESEGVLRDVPAEQGGKPARSGEVLPDAGAGDRSRGSQSRGDADRAGQRRGDVPREGRPAANREEAGRGEGARRDAVQPDAGARDRGPRAAKDNGDQPRVGEGVEAPERPDAPRFHPKSQTDLQPAGDMPKAKANVEALETLRRIQAEDRPATPEEQKVLARWGGWGAAWRVFEPHKYPEYQDLHDRMRPLLNDKEWNAAKDNAMNAHYTDAAYVQTMWDAVKDLGFDGGNVLEPGSGSGTFMGFAPDNAHMTGIELDPTSAAISRLLYPDANVRREPFEKTKAPDNTFDLTIGNVPFGKLPFLDKDSNPNKHSLHNAAIIKALRKTRPGGLVAVLTSHHTMDANGKKGTQARQDMADLGDLVGAVRLPSKAHERAAGTDVVTDLLVFRKREEGQPYAGKDFVQSSPLAVGGGDSPINTYFQDNPDAVLGEYRLGGLRANELQVIGDKNADGDFKAAVGRLVDQAKREGVSATAADPETKDAPLDLLDPDESSHEGMIREGDKVFERTVTHNADGSLKAKPLKQSTKFTQVENGREVPFWVSSAQAKELSQLVKLRDLTRSLLGAESASDRDTAAAQRIRKALNETYDAYSKKYGPINRFKWARTGRIDKETGEEKMRRNAPQMGGFRDDPASALVYALEKFDPETQHARKASIFTERTVAKREIATTTDNPADAVALAIETDGQVTIARVAQLLDLDDEDAAEALAGHVFEDHDGSGRLVPTSEYLSGDVRAKLKAARVAAEEDPAFLSNVAALETVVPEDLTAGEIDGRLGAAWIGEEDVQQFLRDILRDGNLRVEHPGGNVWGVEGRRGGVAATDEWGTTRMDAVKIAEKLLTGKQIVVEDTIKGGYGEPDRRVVNRTETEAANAKAEEMQERFAAWLWEDPARAQRLQDLYNDKFNGIVLREYDTSALALPGMSKRFKLRAHQNAAIRRIVSEPSALLAHEVGAGKTLEMVGGVMELRRLGLAKKPAIVVPNHMLEQFSREFLEAYPNANILAAGSDDLSGDKRRRFVARAATGDWDAVIITQGGFKKLGMSKANQEDYLEKKIADLREQVRQQEARGERNSITLKDLQKLLKNREAKIQEKLDKLGDDEGVSFEEAGIDYLMVDEAHMYKNLTRWSNRRELSIEGSDQADDLDMKIDYLRKHTESNRVVTFATATPIANSIGEAYTMMQYLRPDLLEEAGITDFDTWVSTFGTTVTEMEVAPTGGFRMKERFKKFRNVPELLKMFRVATDVKTAEDLGLPVPTITNKGDAQNVVVPASDEFVEWNARALDEMAQDDSPAAVLKYITASTQASLDLRLVGEDGPASKLSAAAEKIAAIHERTKDREYPIDRKKPELGMQDRKGSLQIVFSDAGTPNADGRFSAYDALRDLLVKEHGFDRDSIRFIHEANNDQKKAELFNDARSGKIAVLIGSTAKMGVGTNVQDRAVALHHLDCPWRPADLQQRDGRVERQGNMNGPESDGGNGLGIEMYRYMTEGSIDAYRWQTVKDKSVFIGQMMRGRLDVREIDDLSEQSMSLAVATAVTAGNPHLLEKAKTDEEVKKLTRLDRKHGDSQKSLEGRILTTQGQIASSAKAVQAYDAALAKREDVAGDKFKVKVGKSTFTKKTKTEGGEALSEALKKVAAEKFSGQEGSVHTIGEFGGFQITAQPVNHQGQSKKIMVGLEGVPGSLSQVDAEVSKTTGGGVLTRLENRLDGIEDRRETAQRNIDNGRDELERIKARMGAESPYKEPLENARKRAKVLGDLIEAEENTQADKDQRERAAAKAKAELADLDAKATAAKARRQEEGAGDDASSDDNEPDADAGVLTQDKMQLAVEKAAQVTRSQRGSRAPGGKKSSGKKSSGNSRKPSSSDSMPTTAQEQAKLDGITPSDDSDTVDLPKPGERIISGTDGQTYTVEEHDDYGNVVATTEDGDRVDLSASDLANDGWAQAEDRVKVSPDQLDAIANSDEPAEDASEAPAAPESKPEPKVGDKVTLPDGRNVTVGEESFDGTSAETDDGERITLTPDELAAASEYEEPQDEQDTALDGLDVPDASETSDTPVPSEAPQRPTGERKPTERKPAAVRPEKQGALDMSDVESTPDAPTIGDAIAEQETADRIKVSPEDLAAAADGGDEEPPATPEAPAAAEEPEGATARAGDLNKGDQIVWGSNGAFTVESAERDENGSIRLALAPADGGPTREHLWSEDAQVLRTSTAEPDDTPDEAPDADVHTEADAATESADVTAERPIAPAPVNPDTADDDNYEPKTPTQLDGEKYPLTTQQQKIADAVVADKKDTLVKAKAGTGKTSTLEAIARRMQETRPEDQIVYVAFNKTVQTEATGRMPGNVEPRTGHSLAWAWAGKEFTAKRDRKGMLRRADEIADHLGIVGMIGDLEPAQLAQAVIRTVDKYANSADDKIKLDHLPESLADLKDRDKAQVLVWANKAWKDLSDKDGRINTSFDHIRKMWALSKPDLTKSGSGVKRPATVLFLDEAQDTPPVLAKVIADQKMQKVIVGDADQAIYGFTGATDYLDTAEHDVDLPLNKSWRFGPQVADWGNRFLQVLGSKERVIGGGGQSKIVRDMDGADAILVRSNSGMIGEILREQEAGRTVGVPKGTKADLRSLVDSARYLKGEGSAPERMHEDLAPFRTWQEVVDEAEKSDDPTLNKLTRLVGDYGTDGLDNIVSQIIELEDDPLAGIRTEVKGNRMVLSGDGLFNLNKRLKEADPNPGQYGGRGLTRAGVRWDKANKQWVIEGDEATRERVMDKVRELASDHAGEKPDVIVSTAHKSKGLEWDRVRIGDDFKGPTEDKETGEPVMPSDEELRLAYVAVTRAGKELDPGSLAWVEGYSNPNGEGDKPNLPHAEDEDRISLTTEDLASITDDPEAALPEAQVADAPEAAPAEPEPADVPDFDGEDDTLDADGYITDENDDDDAEWDDDSESEATVPAAERPRDANEDPELAKQLDRELDTFKGDGYRTKKHHGESPEDLPLIFAPEGEPEPFEVPEGYASKPIDQVRVGDVVDFGGGPEVVLRSEHDPEGVPSLWTAKADPGKYPSEFPVHPMRLKGHDTVPVATDPEVGETSWEAWTSKRIKGAPRKAFDRYAGERGEKQVPAETPGLNGEYGTLVKKGAVTEGMHVRGYMIRKRAKWNETAQMLEGVVGGFRAETFSFPDSRHTSGWIAEIHDEDGNHIADLPMHPHGWTAVRDADADMQRDVPINEDPEFMAPEGTYDYPEGLTPSQMDQLRNRRLELATRKRLRDHNAEMRDVADDETLDDTEREKRRQERRRRRRRNRPGNDSDNNAGGLGGPGGAGAGLVPGMFDTPVYGDADTSGAGESGDSGEAASDASTPSSRARITEGMAPSDHAFLVNALRKMGADDSNADVQEAGRAFTDGEVLTPEQARLLGNLFQTAADMEKVQGNTQRARFNRRASEAMNKHADELDAPNAPEAADETAAETPNAAPHPAVVDKANRYADIARNRGLDVEVTETDVAGKPAIQIVATEQNGGWMQVIVSPGARDGQTRTFAQQAYLPGAQPRSVRVGDVSSRLADMKPIERDGVDATPDAPNVDTPEADSPTVDTPEAPERSADERMGDLVEQINQALADGDDDRLADLERQVDALVAENPDDYQADDGTNDLPADGLDVAEGDIPAVAPESTPEATETPAGGFHPMPTNEHGSTDLPKWDRLAATPEGVEVDGHRDGPGYSVRNFDGETAEVVRPDGTVAGTISRGAVQRGKDKGKPQWVGTLNGQQVAWSTEESPYYVARSLTVKDHHAHSNEGNLGLTPADDAADAKPSIGEPGGFGQVVADEFDRGQALNADQGDEDTEDLRPETMVNGNLRNPQGMTLPTDDSGRYEPAQIDYLAEFGQQVMVETGGEWHAGFFRPSDGDNYTLDPIGSTPDDNPIRFSADDLDEVRAMRQAEMPAEAMDSDLLRPGTRVMFQRGGKMHVGVLVGKNDEGRTVIRDANGVEHETTIGGKVRPIMGAYLPGAEPTEEAFAPVPGVWTQLADGRTVSASPGEYVAAIAPDDQGGYRWEVRGVQGSNLGTDRGTADSPEAAKAQIEDVLASWALDANSGDVTMLPGDNADERDRKSTDLGDQMRSVRGETTSDASDTSEDTAGPEPVQGQPAAWVPTGELEPGDVAHVEGDNGNGSATTRTGHVLGTPETVEVHAPGKRPEKGTRTTVGDSPTGDGDRGTVLSPADSVAARATRDEDAGTGDNPASVPESNIMAGRIGDTVPGDSNGLGVFPGSVVTDGRGREGLVTETSDRDVAVRWAGKKEDERVRPGTLTIVEGRQQRPEGWTKDGRQLAVGQVVRSTAGESGPIESLDGDTATVITPEGFKHIDAGDLTVIGQVREDDQAAQAREPWFDAPTGPEGLDVRPTDPIKPEPLPEGVESGTVNLKPEHLAALNDLGIDTDATSLLDVQQAAARLRHGMPVTADQADALAKALRAMLESKKVEPGKARQIKRVANRLDAARDRLRETGPVTDEPSESEAGEGVLTQADGLVVGDVVALPSPTGGEMEVGTVTGRLLTQNGQIVDLTVEMPDGSRRHTKLTADGQVWRLPDLPAQGSPVGGPAADSEMRPADVDREFTEPRISDRLGEAADAVVENALDGADEAESIEDLAEHAGEQIDTRADARDQKNANRRLDTSFEQSGVDPEVAERSADAAAATADEVAEETGERIRRSLGDAHPWAGESDAEAAERWRSRLREAAADFDRDEATQRAMGRVDEDWLHQGDAPGTPSPREQARARRELQDALRADLFQFADELARLGDTENANTIALVAARLAGKPDEVHVQAAVSAVAMGRHPSKVRTMVSRLRGMLARQRQRFLDRVRSLMGTGRKAKRSLKAAIAAARTEWTGDDRHVERVIADAAKHLAAGGDQEGGGVVVESEDFADRLSHFRDVLPSSGAEFGYREGKVAGYAGITLDALRSGRLVRPRNTTALRLDRDADGGPGTTALEHVSAVKGLGDVLDRETTARVRAALPDLGDDPRAAVREARRYADEIAADERADLTDSELTALRKKARKEADDLARRYADARAAAILDVLAGQRSMGPQGAASLNVQGRKASAPEVKALRWAEQHLPTDWLAGAGTVEAQAGRMGGYDDGTITVAPLGDAVRTDAGKYGASALHGLAHHIETTVPGIKNAMWAYGWTRTSDGSPGDRTRRGRNTLGRLMDLFPGVGYDRDQLARPGDWPFPEMGAENEDGHSEAFALGVQAMFAGDAWLDDDLEKFLMGLMYWMERNR